MEPADRLSTAWIAWTLKLKKLESDIQQYVFNDRFKHLSLQSGKVSPKDDRYALLYDQLQALVNFKDNFHVNVNGVIK